MADRRMFTKKITDSDNFTAMPPTTQCLYFHLCMGADDEGFSNSIRQSMFNAHATTDDFNTLVQKRFIIPFDSGVIVIKHWRMHNYIQKDRFHETKYLEEKAQLVLKENDAYSLEDESVYKMDTSCIQNGYKMDTEVRLGEVRARVRQELGEERLEEQPSAVCIDYQKIVASFNNTCKSYPKVKSLSADRKKAIRARLNNYSEADLQQVFEKAEASDFLKGANSRNWSANFDWLMKDTNIAKVLDGNYDNKTTPAQEDVFAKYGV